MSLPALFFWSSRLTCGQVSASTSPQTARASPGDLEVTPDELYSPPSRSSLADC
jgi:hypothetical protein